MGKIKNWYKNLERVNGMLVIRNKIIPFQGYKMTNVFGILFTKPNAKIDKETINHESIHSKQIKEIMLLSYWIVFIKWWLAFAIPLVFYIWYAIEWLVRIIAGQENAYRKVSFEKDAYECQASPDKRKWFGWVKYIFVR